MSFSTFDPPGDIPNMDLDSILSNIEQIDPEAYYDMNFVLDAEQKTKKREVLAYLRENEPLLFVTLEQSLRFYQTAFMQAGDATQALAASYRRWRVLNNTLERVKRIEIQTELARQVQEEKPAQKKKKRDRAPQPENAKHLLLDHVRVTAQEMDKRADRPLFFSQEKFTADFDLSGYVHLVKKGHKKWALMQVNNYGTWEMIYHCSGQWQAEDLVHEMEQEGRIAIILKRLRCSEETMTYKVLVGIPKK